MSFMVRIVISGYDIAFPTTSIILPLYLKSPSLSELTPIIFNMELTNLSSESSNYKL